MCDYHTRMKRGAKKNVIGPTIKEVRLSLSPKVSQQDLAGRLAARGIQIDRSAIARIESRDRFVRDFEIMAIAAALRVPLVSLFQRQG
jgi:transcriptional regulator with XRE-family HTH domain